MRFLGLFLGALCVLCGKNALVDDWSSSLGGPECLAAAAWRDELPTGSSLEKNYARQDSNL
jgi:hypothetical protein